MPIHAMRASLTMLITDHAARGAMIARGVDGPPRSAMTACRRSTGSSSTSAEHSIVTWKPCMCSPDPR
ncbi:hypothetical protein P9139_20925 [Curtobacterium flaccumfaciens]|nr:hypothetical protein P9139_20925 [Curtobacterium flaccumfaciens]